MKKTLLLVLALSLYAESYSQVMGGFTVYNDGHIYFEASNQSIYSFNIQIIATSGSTQKSEVWFLGPGNGFYLGPSTPWKWYWKAGDRLTVVYPNGMSSYWECPNDDQSYAQAESSSSYSRSSSSSNIYSNVSSAITDFGGYNWDIPNLENLDPITVKRIQDEMVQQRVAAGGNIDFLLDPNFAAMQVNQQNQSAEAFANRMAKMTVEQVSRKMEEEKFLFVSNFKESFQRINGRAPSEAEISEALCQYYEIQANVAKESQKSYHSNYDYQDEYDRWESVAKGASKSLTYGGDLYEDSDGNIKGNTNKGFDGSTYPYLKLQQIRKDAQSKMREVRNEAYRSGKSIEASNWENATITY